jgi:uncharacterized protein
VVTNPDRAAYFPAIEKRYGQPIAYWFEQLKQIEGRPYGEQMVLLQEGHGFSRAHANAVVLYNRGSKSARRYDTFDAYLQSCSATQQKTLRHIFATLTKEFPETEVVIAWNQPMLKRGERYLFGAGAQKNHILIAPFDTELLNAIRPRLTEYVVNKKTIRVPNDWDVDASLLVELVAE